MTEIFVRMITATERISEYNPETKQHSEEWHTKNPKSPKKAEKAHKKIKAMFICFFIIKE